MWLVKLQSSSNMTTKKKAKVTIKKKEPISASLLIGLDLSPQNTTTYFLNLLY